MAAMPPFGVHDDAGRFRCADHVASGVTQVTLRELHVRPGRRPVCVDQFAQAIGIELPVTKVSRGHKHTSAQADVRITQPERVIDTQSGLTKGELVAYYDSVAELMLPHLTDRPMALVRAPSGVADSQFFQKHSQALSIPGLKVLDKALDAGHEALLSVTTRKALWPCAQLKVFELHSGNDTGHPIDVSDRLVFDLDPVRGVAWAEVKEGARLLRSVLAELKLESWVGTSSGEGLQVIVPLTPRYHCGAVSSVSHAIVAHLAKVIPQRFVAKSRPRNRVGRIFIDYPRRRQGLSAALKALRGLGFEIDTDGNTRGPATGRHARRYKGMTG